MSTTQNSNLEGQRALVTGATSGIGKAVALGAPRSSGAHRQRECNLANRKERHQ